MESQTPKLAKTCAQHILNEEAIPHEVNRAKGKVGIFEREVSGDAKGDDGCGSPQLKKLTEKEKLVEMQKAVLLVMGLPALKKLTRISGRGMSRVESTLPS